jgi:hypothetical protein
VITDPRLGHRTRPWTLSSPTSLVVGIKESTSRTCCEFSCLFPSSPTIYLSRARLPPTFWLSARHPCVSVCISPAPHFSPYSICFSNVPGTNPLTTNHVILQTCPYHFTHPHQSSTNQLGAARRIRRMGYLRAPVRRVPGLSSTLLREGRCGVNQTSGVRCPCHRR